MRNLTELVLDRARRRPDARFGMIDGPSSLADSVDAGRQVAAGLLGAGVRPGMRVAVVGSTSNSYLVAWLGLVFAGTEPALINPAYPDELLADMIGDLEPAAVVWMHRRPVGEPVEGVIDVDATAADRGTLIVDGCSTTAAPLGDLPGLARGSLDVAGFMHTSGTSGVPKFCEQTHEYFIRLGTFVADAMQITEADTVFAPLPMFHINPLGYAVVGGLTGGASVLGSATFSASAFWPLVRRASVTVVFLHGPPVEILKRATSADDAAGHAIDRVFFADDGFLDAFDVPLGYSGYGSTEAGGLTHVWQWRRGDHPEVAEGMSRYGGRARDDVEWRVVDDGEILVRGRSPGVLFSGYRNRNGLTGPFDEQGWFHTGDLGRVDSSGNLVFIERRTESIRVKGEYVPIGYVEERFSAVEGVSDVAVWRRQSDLVDDEVVLYAVAEEIDLDGIRAVAASLPPFMRPACIAVVRSLPRDTGVGKVRRRLLDVDDALEVLEL